MLTASRYRRSKSSAPPAAAAQSGGQFLRARVELFSPNTQPGFRRFMASTSERVQPNLPRLYSSLRLPPWKSDPPVTSDAGSSDVGTWIRSGIALMARSWCVLTADRNEYGVWRRTIVVWSVRKAL